MVITLCGSARFERLFHQWNKALSLSGHVVFSLSCFPSIEGNKDWFTQEEKAIMDTVHLTKISESDAVLFLNKHGYLGESSLSELRFAKTTKTSIHMLQSWGLGCGVLKSMHTAEAFASKISDGVPPNYTSPIDATRFRDPWSLLTDDLPLRRKIVDMLEGE